MINAPSIPRARYTYWDIFPVLLQLVSLHNTKRIVLDGKGVVDDAGDVVVQDPSQGRVQLGIDALDIVQVDWFVEEHLVEGRREPAVDVVTVEDGNANDAADKVKIAQMVFIHGRICINLKHKSSNFGQIRVKHDYVIDNTDN